MHAFRIANMLGVAEPSEGGLDEAQRGRKAHVRAKWAGYITYSFLNPKIRFKESLLQMASYLACK